MLEQHDKGENVYWLRPLNCHGEGDGRHWQLTDLKNSPRPRPAGAGSPSGTSGPGSMAHRLRVGRRRPRTTGLGLEPCSLQLSLRDSD
jgi:hypothetical protein